MIQKKTYSELRAKLVELGFTENEFIDELPSFCREHEHFFGKIEDVSGEIVYTNEVSSKKVWHFKDHDVYMAMDVTWYSYNGFEYDSGIYQVWPHAVGKIEYLKVPTKDLTFDEFLVTSKTLKVSIGRVHSVVRISGSNKLLDMEVSFGDHTRHVVTNIGGQVQDEQSLVGKKFQFVMNLAPVTMMGVKSEAMILLPTYNGTACVDDAPEGASVLG